MAKPTKIPAKPGVYFHKDNQAKIIYVGKAARLNARINQYFQAASLRTADAKTKALVAAIAGTDWIETDSELEAVFLEAEMIKRYKPHYNILERDDKAWQYVRIDRQSPYPSLTITRNPLDDKARYYGPYVNSYSLRRALKYLRKVFPYSTHKQLPSRACLDHHLGLCPGPETDQFDLASYRQDLSRLGAYLTGKRRHLVKTLTAEMKLAAAHKNYELAARRRDQLRALSYLNQQTIFGDKENLDLSKDHALDDICRLFKLKSPPRRIEGYDVSHMSAQHTVASMVVFLNGVSSKSDYRRFKLRLPGNDDFAHIAEVVGRRFQSQRSRGWPAPDLVLIDGGPGQLSSALAVAPEAKALFLGLAKKQEQIIVARQTKIDQASLARLAGRQVTKPSFISLELPRDSHLLKLLQRIRDESHRFAVSYHSLLKRQAQTKSQLTDIPTIGPATRRKLLKAFGSLKAIKQASQSELVKVVGQRRAEALASYLKSN